MDGPITIKKKVVDQKYLLYGFFAGVAISWYFGGQQGEMSGVLMLAAVGVFILYTRKSKPEPKTIYDVIRDAAKLHKEKTGIGLDWTNAKVYSRGGDWHFIQFYNPTLSLTVKAKVSGTQEITNRSAESMKNERDNIYTDTGVYEVE
jgi:hypothetical protein